MRTKNITICLLLVFTTFFISSCNNDDLVKINENPNQATNIQPEFLFGYSTLAWSGARTGGDLFLPVGFANQSLATGGNSGWGYGEDRYDISPFSIGNTWRFYFVNGANNLKLAIDKAESASPINNNAAAQCKIVLANTMYEVTMIYGDVPYREAWNPDFPNPKFDPQEQVLNDLIELLDEAINQIEVANPLKIVSNDAYFKGDMNKWVKYAKSLKLKILMTMVDKVPAKSSDIATMINQDLLSSAADNVEMPFFDETNAENPKFKLFKRYASGENPWIFANKNVFDFMETRNDPRIPFYFKSNDGGNFEALATATEATQTASTISLENLWKADAPDLIMSYQEVLLFKAEIYARGLGVAMDLSAANTNFKNGVKESLKYYGVSDSDADDYVNNELVDISTLTQEEALEEIHTQQWIDLMDRSLEGWVQSRRTKLPNLTIPNGAPAGGIFKRYPYPDSELSANSNAPTTNPKYYDKMWFEL
ncbi:SusD/RagB family nutrient-binding outer membrane lipoprotein [Tenacibaculum discolor]|uniref:SusD/RagB family nutrient-binding outer membrane lipoprotein n=1 Tax=Tenacibaculum discolor TaxID=361581 RepID=UPI000EB5861F|nr:SusD/RagB family nutrient-binding outer membrane lipoprotein [Tenacibaculum discolor]RLK06664.1 SusD-like starch-binding protein associating with outer membrane [Tenacibaculum discolor]